MAGFMNAGQSWICRGRSACKYSQMVNVEVCSGDGVCGVSHIGYTGDDLRCGGRDSCNDLLVDRVDGDVVCAGSGSCNEVEVQQADALYCDGLKSCSSTSGARGVPSTIYARGQEALSNSNL